MSTLRGGRRPRHRVRAAPCARASGASAAEQDSWPWLGSVESTTRFEAACLLAGLRYNGKEMDPRSRPVLRPVESIVVPDKEHGRVLVLRDTQGITDAHAVIPPVLASVVARFTGRLTCQEIAAEASEEVGSSVPVDVVVRLADELAVGLFLEGPLFRAARARVEREFAEARTRAATHAGGAYHGEASALERYIEESCLAKANGNRATHANGGGSAAAQGSMRALVAPHIDPWRGALGYGRAYAALAAGIPPEADTFVL